MTPPTKISTTITTKQYALPAVSAVTVATTGATNTTPYGFTTSTQANGIVTTVNALVQEVTDLKLVVATLLGELNARNEI